MVCLQIKPSRNYSKRPIERYNIPLSSGAGKVTGHFFSELYTYFRSLNTTKFHSNSNNNSVMLCRYNSVAI